MRERSISHHLDELRRLGIDTIVPYVSNTSGQAHYPSELLSDHLWQDWDPIEVFVTAARQRGLKVQLSIPMLICGGDQPSGILEQHPAWALLGEDGKPLGSISPGHPQAREWVVRWLLELIQRYKPDGLLLDYMRFPSLASQLDAHSAARFARTYPATEQQENAENLQHFRELLLTELVGMISKRVRAVRPDLHVAIYSWGHHVTSGHRLAQNWPAWAAKGYIDEVNVCGYWYPDSYPKRWGKNHIEAFRTVLTDCRRQLEATGSDADLTFALGVKTSHGKVKTVVDIASYLRTAAQLQADGVTFFTWSYLVPFVPQLRQTRLLENYAAQRPIEDLTVANMRGTSDREASLKRSVGVADRKPPTIRVAAKDSTDRARKSAEFVGDGHGDQEQINAAIDALPDVGGTVILAAGTYDIRKVSGTLGGVLIGRSNVVLAGQGAATKLVLAADQNTNVIRIIGSGVHHVTIQDLSVDANRRENSTGLGDPNISHDRFEFCGIKGYCRDPRGPGAADLRDITIRNCEVRNAHRLGIMLEGSNLQVLNNVLGNAGSDSVELLTGPGMIRGNYVEITEQTHVAIGSDRGDSIQMSDNIVHIRAGGRLDIGFRTWADSQRHVINGNILVVDKGGECSLAMDLR
ncbi:MAG: family 10 glycosylhydrolase, partial [Pirellulaceae bacterium]|nr:family 10 glycosylhydrolase [Pirellulaceae bacterium]